MIECQKNISENTDIIVIYGARNLIEMNLIIGQKIQNMYALTDCHIMLDKIVLNILK